ncbi:MULTISPECIES: DUF4124 domain-containing protein [Burkholderiales]|jgi:hypothetical protein|uniref:DUF4124 domain-containing protein n=1 Tax=Burkholderiales TaxID=80840 RepID=UPI001389C7F1|nr:MULTISPECIES: DUF4124 domain-containing protein [unclassified Acidovorax]MBL8364025.1 DUF4124 domain-containing protein [Comamonas sp.]MCL4769940.1 DUF4124 domain-containing protein [Burkholderiaceae bacterium]HNI76763.1 DUF4124 domain-containing protein [Giesbergeria sp.]NCU65870.1 DUF4124 domain-containing protein [Acidovorax sp. 210-6]HNM41131.1 DUF4124 domain-containing protein [Giesbergeria sp.]
MKLHPPLLLAALCLASASAMAQWQWIDKDGRKIFSDRPPPTDVPDSKVLKQPRMGAAVAAPVVAASEPASAPAAAASAAAAGKDKELEKRKAQAEAEEAAKKKAEDDKRAKVRAENCERAKAAKATIDSGKPLRQANAQGELIFMDEAARNAELKRAQAIIDSDCKR